MRSVLKRFEFLFNSTRGLILTAIAAIGIVTAILGMLSGPMAELGLRDIFVRVFGFDLVPAEREGRIVILYHAIAMAVVAIEVYMINGLFPGKPGLKTASNILVTIGYLLAMIFGLFFAYLGHNWVFHGLFIAGLTLIYAAGIVLAINLWPWNKDLRVKDKSLAAARGGVDLERAALFTMAVATLVSALFGAIPGSFYGNGFQTVLAENIVREPFKTPLQDAVIGHLHIMLTLIAIAITLIVGRWLGFRGALHKIAMPLMISGTIVITVGALSVVWVEWAHTIIYVGSVLVMLAALMLVIFGWKKFIQDGTAGIAKPTLRQKLGALLRDPIKFGPLWQMVFMNFTVSGVGIFMAAKLDEIMRVIPWREERITLTGHWHILSAIIATIILFYYADMSGLKGKPRQVFGWGIILFSDIAFAAVTVFSLKRLFVSEAEQQPLVNTLIILGDIGLGVVLILLALLMIWRLADLFNARGRWKEEIQQNNLPAEVSQ